MKTRGKQKTNISLEKDKKVSKQKQTKPAPKNAKKAKAKQQKVQQENVLQVEQKVQQQQQKVEVKQKKAPQPKKYLKKNYQQMSRIARSQYQKIYLLEAERDEDGKWNFTVQGASGSNYKVEIHNTGLKCTCTDFRIKKKPCKHIYFIVTQVAQNVQILDYFNNTLKISKAAYNILDQQLTKRLHSRMNKSQQTKSKQDIDLKDDTDCTICFTQMDKQTQNLQGCTTCKKYFHFECLSAWKKHNPTCPLCRSLFAGSGNDKDPLGKLKTIQINSQPE